MSSKLAPYAWSSTTARPSGPLPGSSAKEYLAAILDLHSRFIVGWALSAVNGVVVLNVDRAAWHASVRWVFGPLNGSAREHELLDDGSLNEGTLTSIS